MSNQKGNGWQIARVLPRIECGIVFMVAFKRVFNAHRIRLYCLIKCCACACVCVYVYAVPFAWSVCTLAMSAPSLLTSRSDLLRNFVVVRSDLKHVFWWLGQCFTNN